MIELAGFRMHAAAGLLLWLVFAAFLWIKALPLDRFAITVSSAFFVAFLGCLLPDADTPKSKLGGFLELSVVLSAVSFGFLTFYRGLATLAQDAVNALLLAGAIIAAFILLRPRHRGPTHTIKAALLYGVLVFAAVFVAWGVEFGLLFGVLALASFVSHLALDDSLK